MNTRTALPHNFWCGRHWHAVTSEKELLKKNVPRCLLERIVLEWCAIEPAEPEGYDLWKVANMMVGLPLDYPSWLPPNKPGGRGGGVE